MCLQLLHYCRSHRFADVSSTYVDYLQADRSTPPTPIETPRPSRPPSKCRRQAGPCDPLEDDPHGALLLAPPDLDGVCTNSNSKSSSRRQSRHQGDASSIPIGLITNSRHRVKCCLLPETCLCSQQEAIYIDSGSVMRLEEERKQISMTRNRRQIIGILVSRLKCAVILIRLTIWQVLQLGIMIHSLVIGLTLSITQGSDFGK